MFTFPITTQSDVISFSLICYDVTISTSGVRNVLTLFVYKRIHYCPSYYDDNDLDQKFGHAIYCSYI